MAAHGTEAILALRQKLNDRSLPLASRMRVVFSLKNVNGPEAVEALASALDDPSALLRHELAYCMGQMQHPSAIPILTTVLQNTAEEPMVRHEAAEALGAIGDPESLPVLSEYAADAAPEVAETCQIAVDLIRHRLHASGVAAADKPPCGADAGPDTVFTSVDPAPPVHGLAVAELRERLLDQQLPMFERYRAMFALRNANTPHAALAIADAFTDPSALLRHELGYVLGQMQQTSVVPALTRILTDPSESAMVRHEAAEALGSIASEETLPILEKYRADPQLVVSQSCIVALDMHEYYNSDQFQYADVLADTSSIDSHRSVQVSS